MKQSLRFVRAMMILLGCLVTACATPYQSARLNGGFSETPLAPDMFRVTFHGNGVTSEERAQDFALLRAAELTLAQGFRYFALRDESSSRTMSTFTTPGFTSTTGSVHVSKHSATYSRSTTYTPGETVVISTPRTGLLIKCFVAKPEGIDTLDATFLQQALKHKYQLS